MYIKAFRIYAPHCFYIAKYIYNGCAIIFNMIYSDFLILDMYTCGFYLTTI